MHPNSHVLLCNSCIVLSLLHGERIFLPRKAYLNPFFVTFVLRTAIPLILLCIVFKEKKPKRMLIISNSNEFALHAAALACVYDTHK